MNASNIAVRNLVSVLVCLFCTLGFTAATAQEKPQSAKEIYEQLLSVDALVSYEFKMKFDKGELPPLFGPSSPNVVKHSELQTALNDLVKSGNPEAMFYLALWKAEQTDKRLQNESSPSEITKRWSYDEYATALSLFKQAGEAGIGGAYWNVALMYENGQGCVQSKLAAVEWYYKAGTSYLKAGDRERALASLEAIQKASKNHELGKRLAANLRKNAPKS